MLIHKNLKTCSPKHFLLQTTLEASLNSALQPFQTCLTLAQTSNFFDKTYVAPINYFYEALHNRTLGSLYRGWQITFILTFAQNLYFRTKTEKYQNKNVFYSNMMLFLVIVYPLRVIGTRYQQDVFGQFKSVWSCAKQIFLHHQVHGLYRGFLGYFFALTVKTIIEEWTDVVFSFFYANVTIPYVVSWIHELYLSYINNIGETINKVMVSGLLRPDRNLFSKVLDAVTAMVQNGGIQSFWNGFMNRLMTRIFGKIVKRKVYK